DDIERPFSFSQFSDKQRYERVGRNTPVPANPIALFRCLISSGAGGEHVVIDAMRHVEHAIVWRAELRQVLSRASARCEMSVEPAEHPACLNPPSTLDPPAITAGAVQRARFRGAIHHGRASPRRGAGTPARRGPASPSTSRSPR